MFSTVTIGCLYFAIGKNNIKIDDDLDNRTNAKLMFSYHPERAKNKDVEDEYRTRRIKRMYYLRSQYPKSDIGRRLRTNVECFETILTHTKQIFGTF